MLAPIQAPVSLYYQVVNGSSGVSAPNTPIAAMDTIQRETEALYERVFSQPIYDRRNDVNSSKLMA